MQLHHTLIALLLFAAPSVCIARDDSRPNAEPEQEPAHLTPARISNVSEMSKGIWIIFQDRKKNHWFGSDGQGVYRYDGKTMTHFTMKDGLPNDRIRDFHEDKSGNIYITTLEGITRFDGQSFTTLTPVESNEWKLEADDLWFKGNSLENGPYRYDGKVLYHLKFPKNDREDEFYLENPRAAASPYGVYTVYRDRNGNMWFGTAALGACRFDGKTLSWLYEDHLTNTPAGGSFGIRTIIEDKNGKFWICNTRHRFDIHPSGTANKDKGLVKYRREKGIESFRGPDGDHIYFQYVIEDQGELWMVTYRAGVWRYDGKKMTHYPVKDGNRDTLLISIYKDMGGVLWLGTQEAGAYRFNGKTFEKFAF